MDHSFNRTAHIKSIYDGNGNAGKVKYEAIKAAGNYKGTFANFSWNKKNPGPGVPDLTKVWIDERDLDKWLKKYPDSAPGTNTNFDENAFWNCTAPVRVLQTHMPSSRTDPKTGFKRTGPLKDEFGILAVDLFQRTGKHEFVFANSRNLNHQAGSPNHLQQNYTIDILVEKDGFKRHPLLPPWFDDFDKCIKDKKPVLQKMDDTQLDKR